MRIYCWEIRHAEKYKEKSSKYHHLDVSIITYVISYNYTLSMYLSITKHLVATILYLNFKLSII